ncbi:MAG: DUF502 domain-containing protein, partial [Candidatus Omnitrophica bacterium]|nr:DUF502 domain-containing protein [Candidatus Omnitrophota bacterium]MBD3268584.1 DUF502 domain-containing protein [Candidatus Omnitrophota bacterium]
LLLFIVTGFFSTRFIGRKIFPLAEKVFFKIPLLSSIYSSLKQLSDFLFKESKRKKFKKVVLVPYPRDGSYSLGFITNEELDDFGPQKGLSLISVFVPLAPAPFSGIILFLPEEEVVVLDISVEQGIKCIVSGGVIPPRKNK